MDKRVPRMTWSTRLRCALAVMDYFLFGIGGFFVSVILVIARCICGKHEQVLGSITLQYSWKLMCLLLRCTWNLKLKAPQKREMEKIQASIIVANHPSLIDVVILTSIIPRCMLIVKPALLRWAFLRPILRRLCIVNDGNTEQMMQHANEALKKGFNIIIFPEGTRSSPHKKNKFQRGAFHLSIQSNAPIVPIHIHTSQPFLTKEAPWWYTGEHCPVFTLTKHAEIYPKPNQSSHREAVRLCRLTEELLLS